MSPAPSPRRRIISPSMRRSASCWPAASPISPDSPSRRSRPLAPLLPGLGLAVAVALPGISLLGTGPEAAIQKLLLTLHQLLQAAHHLLGLARPLLLHLAGLRRAQVLQHLLKLREQFAGLVARAAARHLAGAIQHLLQIAAGSSPGRDRPAASPRRAGAAAFPRPSPADSGRAPRAIPASGARFPGRARPWRALPEASAAGGADRARRARDCRPRCAARCPTAAARRRRSRPCRYRHAAAAAATRSPDRRRCRRGTAPDGCSGRRGFRRRKSAERGSFASSLR